ncbi:MAG: 3(2), 5-bisphosphate nucleotidase, partial [Actinomycetota bacterium]|nr:3(2), 5-bisphosphate nucleotidase [Actinomycetota bacterium]
MTEPWGAATAAAVEVGDGVAALRGPLADLIAVDRMAAQVQADLYAHTTLGERLAAAYPGVPIVSEEDAAHAEDRPADYWLIDPIDGTASWSSGFPGFVCQLARIVDGTVVFSVIHAPVLGSTWTAVRGGGAHLDGVLLSARPPAPAKGVVVIDNYPEPRGVCDRVMQWLGTQAYLESGSIGLKAALGEKGVADLAAAEAEVRTIDADLGKL